MCRSTIDVNRLMASESATEVPPNFITTLIAKLPRLGGPGRAGGPRRAGKTGRTPLLPVLPVPPLLPSQSGPSQQPLGLHQLGVEDGRAGRSANRVMAERAEFVVEDGTRTEPADADRHPAVP